MSPWPMRLSRRDFRAIATKSESRKARRLEKALESTLIADAVAGQYASKSTANGPRTRVRAKKVPKAKMHKRLTAALDIEFSLSVRADWPVCFWDGSALFPYCGKETKDCFHFFTRAKRSIRWDYRNAVGSCKGHNILYEQDQAFIDDVRLWFVKKWGQAAWDQLKLDGNKIAKFENETLAMMLDGIRTRRALAS